MELLSIVQLILFNIVTFQLVLWFPPVMFTHAMRTPAACGEYGFTCIDEKQYQICETLQLHEDFYTGDFADYVVNDKVETGMCPDDTVCNEEYPFYCSPSDTEEKVGYEDSENISALHSTPATNNELIIDNASNHTNKTKLVNNTRKTIDKLSARGKTVIKTTRAITITCNTTTFNTTSSTKTEKKRATTEISPSSGMNTTAPANESGRNGYTHYLTAASSMFLPFTNVFSEMMNTTIPHSQSAENGYKYNLNASSRIFFPFLNVHSKIMNITTPHSPSATNGYTYYLNSSSIFLQFSDVPSEKTDETTIRTTTPLYPCRAPGNFPDPNSYHEYFFCDIDNTGEGYIAVHRTCLGGRIFDTTLRECMLPQIVDVIETNHFRSNRFTEAAFSCTKEGKFPIPHVPRSYYKCELSEDETFVVRKIDCENGTIFDKYTQACMNLPQKYHRSIEYMTQIPSTKPSTNTTVRLSTFYKSSFKTTTYLPEEIEILVPPPATPKPEPRPYVCHSAGRHADPNNCTVFYVCHPKRSLDHEGFYKVQMVCPYGKIFDQHKQYCVAGPLITRISRKKNYK